MDKDKLKQAFIDYCMKEFGIRIVFVKSNKPDTFKDLFW